MSERWEFVCEEKELEDSRPIRVEVAGLRLAVVRIDESVYGVDDRCSHQNYALSEGEVDPEELTIECWKHGSRFSLLTGHPTCLPATKPVRVYELKTQDGAVWVKLP
jgi:3-phenylpropionate/trans-cinnamate dioxygenase ferredoxin subunit